MIGMYCACIDIIETQYVLNCTFMYFSANSMQTFYFSAMLPFKPRLKQ